MFCFLFKYFFYLLCVKNYSRSTTGTITAPLT